MNQFIERISNPGISISRNVIEDDDEDAYRLEELERDPKSEVKVNIAGIEKCQLLVVCVAEAASIFGRSCFGTSSKAHDKLSKAGNVNLRGAPFGTFYTNSSGVVVLEFSSKLQTIEEEVGYAADMAYTVMEALSPENLVVLGGHFLAKYYPPEPEEEVEPPLLRILATSTAREDLNERSKELPFLETGNLVRGLGPAFLTEAELRNTWGVLAVSYQAAHWFSYTVLAFMPVLEAMKAKALLDTDLSGTAEEIRER